jgi:alpha/beta superfamily hydrolase
MPEVIISGNAGRIEGIYHSAEREDAPMALVLHPHPMHGGTMNNKVVYNLHHCFVRHGFSTLRINFRGAGRSEGKFDDGIGELTDAATALNWLQLQNPMSNMIWVAGFSFGSWIAMQLLMRRPEINYFIAVSPPVGKYDFSFLSPCPISGLILQGDQDSIISEEKVTSLAQKLAKQKNAKIDYTVVRGADHFYRTKMDELTDLSDNYVAEKLGLLSPTSYQKKSKFDKRRRHPQLEHA